MATAFYSRFYSGRTGRWTHCGDGGGYARNFQDTNRVQSLPVLAWVDVTGHTVAISIIAPQLPSPLEFVNHGYSDEMFFNIVRGEVASYLQRAARKKHRQEQETMFGVKNNLEKLIQEA
jgi:hypothetical protein